jgi:cellulose synthase/poly-beta-1,6-N-acetylglucosamine synthase-like glycosyltransferase
MSNKHPDNLPTVTVVIPVLNCVDDVEGCIDSLRVQTYPADRIEVIIVDNGSSDGTHELLTSMGVPTFVCPTKGRSRALNVGLRHAKGEIICTTDISCRPEPNWIEEVVTSFEKPEVGCVAGEIKLLDTHQNIAIDYQRRINYMSPMHARLRTKPPYLPYADGANASFRKKVFDEIGPFEDSFIKAADVEICYRMLFMTDYKIAFHERALVWEPGEGDLRTLLYQRYRIGIGNILLRKRFPTLFVGKQRKSIKAVYWKLREAALVAMRTIGLSFRSLWQRQARLDLLDIVLSKAMSFAETLGRIQGKRHLASTDFVPESIDSPKIADYVVGRWDVSSRVIVS